jgi:hypothetical protein
MNELRNCRTAAWGGYLWQCDHGGQEHDASHSCRHRRCPNCHPQDPEAWLAERRQDLLPVPSLHVVFPVPHELGEVVRRPQHDLYDILIRAAAQALIKLAAAPHYVGGLIGGLGVLHTWTRTVAYHPHVHCLGPAGPPVLLGSCPCSLAALSWAVSGAGAAGTARPADSRVGLDHGVGRLWQPCRARHGADLALLGPVCPPGRADQPPPALHRGSPGLLPLPGRPRPALADHDLAGPGGHPALSAACVAPGLPQSPR